MDNLKQKELVALQFHGKTSEYFGIWIVNILLSIITLGIYSAWAKVRAKRYFYGNTELNGHRFNYLATPIQILKGRIIAVIVFALYMFVSSAFPAIGAIFALVLFIASPYLICASLRFNSRMTSYQNVRFDFVGQYGQAFVNFIVLPIASLFTLYLALPWVLKRIDTFLVSNIRYGDKAFKTELSTSYYYKTSLIVAILFIAVFAVIYATGVLSLFASPSEATPMLFLSMAVLYILAFTLIHAIYIARIRNHIYQQTELDDICQFNSQVNAFHLVALQVTNLIALICTFGLALPWVNIRTTQFFITRTDVLVYENHADAIDSIKQNASALTEELSEVFDIDVALT
ncbi:membrane protein [Thalassotalea insulae]|uniref:Membrane protein n=1 Tax=Thalassotalea insulae TaxID=2056778 RepID=A0ABQ6GZX2_9GAMM|nr:YjgN family protein [Thalassotalea insulae]GLX79776.1 membrane protein [Thalassotalea insulae]